MSTKLDEIYEAVLPEMAAHNIDDTLENRHAFLSGLRDSWLEDETTSIEKSLYLLAVGFEIISLERKIRRQHP